MANVNTQLSDAATSHSIYLNRYESQLVNRFIPIIIKGETTIREIFNARLVAILESGFNGTPAQSRRTQRLIQELGDEIQAARSDESIAAFALALNTELEEFADYESGFIVNSHNSILKDALEGTPFSITFASIAAGLAWQSAQARPFTISPNKAATTLDQYLSGIAPSERARIVAAVTNGVKDGLSTPDIVSSVFGTVKDRKNNTGTSATVVTRRGAESLIRTIVTHVSTVAKDEVYKKNSDLIKGLEWTSQLDSRTTPICQGRDGEVYPVDSGPRPPAHIACRSVMTPVLRSYRELGINVDEPAESTRAYFAIPEKMNVTQFRAKLRKEGLTKAQQNQIISSLSGQTDAKDFGEFLSRQSKEFQETVLGKQRTELYRKGELTLKELISPKGKYYTLDELRALQPSAFEKAGIE